MASTAVALYSLVPNESPVTVTDVPPLVATFAFKPSLKVGAAKQQISKVKPN